MKSNFISYSKYVIDLDFRYKMISKNIAQEIKLLFTYFTSRSRTRGSTICFVLNTIVLNK